MQAVDKDLEHFWTATLVELTSAMIFILQQRQKQKKGGKHCTRNEFKFLLHV